MSESGRAGTGRHPEEATAVTVTMVTMVMVTVAAALAVAAVVTGYLVTLRASGMSRADRAGWRTATRGRTAARRRRREAALVAGLTRRGMSRADYQRAMADLAATDATRCPVQVPRLGKR